MALAPNEIPLLAELLGKMEWPLPREVFHVLCRKTVTVPIELAVLDGNGYIFLIHRKDQEYEGWHMPGTVLRDNESVPEAINRLLVAEVPFEVTSPKSLGWIEISRGNGEGEDPSRHEISLLHVCAALDPNPLGEFFSHTDLPVDTLSHHRKLIARVVG